MIISKARPLPDYLAKPEKIDPLWLCCEKKHDAAHFVSIETYTLFSQTWPKASSEKSLQTTWKHKLTLYRPDVLSSAQALLFVNGGTCNPETGQDNPGPHELDFGRIAAETQSLVVDLQDVPNQYLPCADGLLRKGDRLYADSWNRFLKDPNAGPLILPMTKAVLKAMDAVQQILAQEYFIQIEHFVISGLSKRGLATWLAALHDERIAAIIPVVIDVLNTKKVMQHIYAVYQQQWPPAFYDFIQEKIPEKLDLPEFEAVLNIEDPLAYLNNADQAEYYKKRLSIPKYIISASGDDFFTPDCLNLYRDALPGPTALRVVPNQGHYIDLKVVEASLLAYYHTYLKHNPIPVLQWSVNQNSAICHVVSNRQPQEIQLWEAENKERCDFRFSEKIIYRARPIVGSFREGAYHYPISVTTPTQGFKAHFVELTFRDRDGFDLVLTTSAQIMAANPEAVK